jgi:hypothetical protein
MRGHATLPVMAGLDPAIHHVMAPGWLHVVRVNGGAWMAGSSPAMTGVGVGASAPRVVA